MWYHPVGWMVLCYTCSIIQYRKLTGRATLFRIRLLGPATGAALDSSNTHFLTVPIRYSPVFSAVNNVRSVQPRPTDAAAGGVNIYRTVRTNRMPPSVGRPDAVVSSRQAIPSVLSRSKKPPPRSGFHMPSAHIHSDTLPIRSKIPNTERLSFVTKEMAPTACTSIGLR